MGASCRGPSSGCEGRGASCWVQVLGHLHRGLERLHDRARGPRGAGDRAHARDDPRERAAVPEARRSVRGGFSSFVAKDVFAEF